MGCRRRVSHDLTLPCFVVSLLFPLQLLELLVYFLLCTLLALGLTVHLWKLVPPIHYRHRH